MPIDPRFKVTGQGLKRDVRPWTVRFVAWLKQPEWFCAILFIMAGHLLAPAPQGRQAVQGTVPDLQWTWALVDIFLIIGILYFRWFRKQLVELPLKLPQHAGKLRDKNNPNPANGSPGKPEGILFLGNVRDGPTKNDELWLTNSDARTHMLFLGTTGAGKTEGLKSLISNALCWGSGFVYVDGKAQNTLWGDVYSLARRFGRDDDVLVLNYMTGNSDNSSRSNSLNPFSIGSASYLVQMMVGLMDDSGGDNAMWKGRAISLLSALLPALTWKRDNQGLMLDVGVIRDNLIMQQIIKMSRDPALPDRVIRGLQSYLDTLPGYVDSAFDDEGNERPPSQDQPMVDLSQTRQQHGYLTMQFTRALSSLADEYGYIFKQQMADIDMMDVVINRRILVVLIPALEKSPDEAANLGKIVVAALKGMMGATLGSELEGEQTSIIDNNPTTAATPFMTVFDEVGYYTSPGMGVMAAQARSLGFSLIFAGQDMPALQKRVKEEALSIAGNCNLKIFGKLEDPTETKDFFEKTVGSALVSEASGFSSTAGGMGGRSYFEGDNISFQARKEASYDDLRRQGQGQVHFLWADKTVSANMFYSNPKRVNVVRVQRFLGVTPRNWAVEARDRAVNDVMAHLRDSSWRAGNGAPAQVSQEISLLAEGYGKASASNQPGEVCGATAVGNVLVMDKRRATEAVSVPGVGTDGGQGYWPFGAAGGVQPAALPPAMPGGVPAPMAAGPNTPSWMGGAPAQPVPVQQGGYQPPPYAVPPQGQPQQSAPPPWAGGGQPQQQSVPQQPAYQQSPLYGGASPVPPAGQQLSWGNVMGAAAGMGTPPGGARVAQAGAVPPPPPWLLPPAGGQQAGAAGMPPQQKAAPPPWQGGGSVTPPYQQQPPYAQPPQQQGYAPPPYTQPPQQQQAQGYVQPPQQGGYPQQQSAPPPWQGGAPVPPPPQRPQAAPPPSWVQQPAVQQPVQPPPSWVQQSPVQPPQAPQQVPPPYMPPAVQQPVLPQQMPPQQRPQPPQAPEDVEAILRGAADNLSGEMFPEGQPPKKDDKNQQ